MSLALPIGLFAGASLFKLSQLGMPVLEGFIGWLVGTFFFHWWHRLRHQSGFWVVFHQVHHSPTRIEAFTSFYKHPVEILADSALAAGVLFILLGVSLESALSAPIGTPMRSRRPADFRATTSARSRRMLMFKNVYND
jgi:sterol desaturase/sphingolipid hydroxylase (fatty acid hydroxylase superfamily)